MFYFGLTPVVYCVSCVRLIATINTIPRYSGLSTSGVASCWPKPALHLYHIPYPTPRLLEPPTLTLYRCNAIIPGRQEWTTRPQPNSTNGMHPNQIACLPQVGPPVWCDRAPLRYARTRRHLDREWTQICFASLCFALPTAPSSLHLRPPCLPACPCLPLPVLVYDDALRQ